MSKMQLKQIVDNIKIKLYEGGQRLFKCSNHLDSIYIVLQGTVIKTLPDDEDDITEETQLPIHTVLISMQ